MIYTYYGILGVIFALFSCAKFKNSGLDRKKNLLLECLDRWYILIYFDLLYQPADYLHSPADWLHRPATQHANEASPQTNEASPPADEASPPRNEASPPADEASLPVDKAPSFNPKG